MPYLIAILLLLLIGCGGSNESSVIKDGDAAGALSDGSAELTNQGVQIAREFRSESLIEYNTEEAKWYGEVDKKRLLDFIYDAAHSGNHEVYDYLTWNVLTQQDIRNIEMTSDTVLVENYETGEMETKVISDTIRKEDITKLYVWEDWYFNDTESHLSKNVKAVGLGVNAYDESGSVMGHRILYVVRLEETGLKSTLP